MRGAFILYRSLLFTINGGALKMELDDTLYIWYNQMNLRTESAPSPPAPSHTPISLKNFRWHNNFAIVMVLNLPLKKNWALKTHFDDLIDWGMFKSFHQYKKRPSHSGYVKLKNTKAWRSKIRVIRTELCIEQIQ